MEFTEDQVMVRRIFLDKMAARVWVRDVQSMPEAGSVVDLGGMGKMKLVAWTFHAHLRGLTALAQDEQFRTRQPDRLIEDYESVEE